MEQVTKLVAGQVYDYWALTPAGWSNGQADYGGIDHGEYFADVDGNPDVGRYQGPDEDGVEPLYYAETTADLIDSYTADVIRKATVAEMEESLNCGQPEGHILVDGRRCYVAC